MGKTSGLRPEPHQGPCPWTPDRLSISDPGIYSFPTVPGTAPAAVRRRSSSGLSVTSLRALSRAGAVLGTVGKELAHDLRRRVFNLCSTRRIFAKIDGFSHRGVRRELNALRQPLNLNSIELSIRCTILVSTFRDCKFALMSVLYEIVMST
jgi:hypothetical protein